MHDVEKHLPAMRRYFALVSFIPDWRIDDLMVSFAAPGGGAGPHRDNYDVFLCQGFGVREWRVTTSDPGAAPDASDELSLLIEFRGDPRDFSRGDVLYLPPGVAHWGTARRATMTFSIGMRAPQRSDLTPDADAPDGGPFYADPDLRSSEATPGLISAAAIRRAGDLSGDNRLSNVAVKLGKAVTSTKPWLTPDTVSGDEATQLVDNAWNGRQLALHGMCRIAWSDAHVFVNGHENPRPGGTRDTLIRLCADRRLRLRRKYDRGLSSLLCWLARCGAFKT